MAENGDGGQMVIVLLLGVVVMMCLSSCCSSLLTAYANECDTGGMFSMFAGEWYWNLVPSTGILGCTAGGTTGASTTVASTTENTTEQIEENKKNQPTTSGGSTDSKCNIGTEANYDYRVREKNSNGEWKCPSGWADTRCGLVSNADGKWVDGDTTGAKQCRKRKSGTTGSNSSSSSSSSDLKVKLVDDPNKGPGSATWDVGVGDYPNLMQDLDRTWNDRIAGFDIPKGLRVIAYTNSNFGGTSITLDGKDEKDAKGYYTHWLDRVNGEQMWDKISSLKVQDMRSSTLPSSTSNMTALQNSQIKDAVNKLKVTAAYLSAKKKSKCNVGKEDGYKFRLRLLGSSGKYSCPQGWKETNCGKVSYDIGNGKYWVDGTRLGAMQCKKKA